MPADFDRCVSQGGRVRTISVGKDKYMRVCYDRSGNSHAGEVRRREGKSMDANMLELLAIREQQQIKERAAADEEVRQSKEQQDKRIEAARRDPTINLHE